MVDQSISEKIELPQIRSKRRTERVLDPRMCVINHCPFLLRSTGREDQQQHYNCGAGVFQAQLPADDLHEYIAENPEPVAGYNADTNPFLLRLLMATECLRPECGDTDIEYIERVLDIDPKELKTELFS